MANVNSGSGQKAAVGVPTSNAQQLQGLLLRKTATAEPRNAAQYFNHVADLVRVNEELTATRRYTLKRRWKVAAYGYESVLNRKKRSAVITSKPSVTGPAHLIRAPTPAPVPSSSSSGGGSGSGGGGTQRTTAKSPIRPVAVQPAPTPTPPTQPQVVPTTAPSPVVPPSTSSTPKAKSTPPPAPAVIQQPPRVAPSPLPVAIPVASAPQQAVPLVMPSTMAATVPKPQQPPPPPVPIPIPTQSMPVPTPLQPQVMATATAASIPRRSDFVVGTRVMIRHTADLVACGARNLVGKTGRIVAVPQVYGQEVYSVYIDEHETMFQVPFNALVLVSAPVPAPIPLNMPHQPGRSMHQMTSTGITTAPAVAVSAAGVHGAAHMRPGPSIEDIKLEHSYQLHRLMQQQYREIQVLQQQYAECRIVNPAALPSIQKELSKLRLVHLSQVQTLKSKQALDLVGK